VNAIEARDVSKVYRAHGRSRFTTLKSAFLSPRGQRGGSPEARFQALKGVTFDVAAGRSVGVVGRNGSGKSTLLKMMAGIGRPTSGTVRVNGRLSALIELGAGFHPEISGRENVLINGMMLGLTRRQVERRFDEIVTFAEMEAFIDAPVKTYSSGMQARLGFAVAVHIEPDVLLVDEVLAVGDESFSHKCLDRFAELRRQGRTIVLVTHALDLVTRHCHEALWLDKGQLRAQGDPQRVIDAYLTDVAKEENVALAASDAASRSDVEAGGTQRLPANMFEASEGRWGSREVEIVGCDVVDAEGQPTHVIESGAGMTVRLRVHAAGPVGDVVFGVGIFRTDGVCCYGSNTLIEGAPPGEVAGSGEVAFHVPRLDLLEGTYKLDVAAHRQNGVPYDYHRLMYTLRVTSAIKDSGVFRPAHRWTFGGGVRISGL